MNSVLVVHLALGIVVALSAALFVWRKLGRRVTLYLLTAQIVLGIYLMTKGLKAPSPHYALAFLAFVGYMIANGMGRKAGNDRNVLIITGISTVMVLAALALGLHAGGML